MATEEEVKSFIGASFRSVWTLELLCHLRRSAERQYSPEQLIADLRASDLVVRQSLTELAATGLILVEGDGTVRYAPATPELEQLASATEALYAKAPNAVRRTIVNAANPSLTAFANAFRLRGDKQP
jgi:DNA-binding GntR family transcriptional regulator